MVTDSEGYIHIIEYLTEHLSLFENSDTDAHSTQTVMAEIEEQLSAQLISLCSQNKNLTFNIIYVSISSTRALKINGF